MITNNTGACEREITARGRPYNMSKLLNTAEHINTINSGQFFGIDEPNPNLTQTLIIINKFKFNVK